MSWQAVEWVLTHSQSTHAGWQVAVVLAHHADAQGRNAYPSIATIANRANLGPTAVKAGLKQLRQLGEIEATGVRPSGTRCYRIAMDGGRIPTPSRSDSGPGAGHIPTPSRSDSGHEPSLEPPDEIPETHPSDDDGERERVKNLIRASLAEAA